MKRFLNKRLHLTVLMTCGIGLAVSASHAAVFKPQKDCFVDTLKKISDRSLPRREEKRLIAAARYNERIFIKASDHTPEWWVKHMDSAIEDYANYDSRIDPKDFKRWLREEPINPGPDETVGDFLKRRFQVYKKRIPDVDLQKVASQLPDELKTVASKCNGDEKCIKLNVGKILSKRMNGTCLAKNKSAAMRSMVTSLALATAGYSTTYLNHPDKGFPWDMMVNTMFWTPILSEMGCRNTLAKGDIGNKIEFGQISRKEKIRMGVNNYVDYMKIAPLTNVTYMSLHTIRQVSEGEKKLEDLNFNDMTKQMISLTMLDGAVLMPRSILITDPLFMKGFPKLRNFYYNKSPVKAAAEGVYLASDFGTRIAINAGSTEIIYKWLETSDQYFDTKFLGKQKEPENEVNQTREDS
jgi:hypothetical protein